jgi:hypothetical protein
MKKYTRSFVERKGTALTQNKQKRRRQWWSQDEGGVSCDVFQNCKRRLSSCSEFTIRLSLSPLRIGCRMTRRDDDSVEQQRMNDDEKRMIPTML